MSTKTVTKGSPVGTVFLVMVLVLLLFGGGLLLWHTVAPESFFAVLGASANDQTLYYQGQLNETQAALNASQGNLSQTQAELGAARAAVLQEQLKHYAWPIGIGLVIVGLAFIWFLWKFLGKKSGLTMEEAWRKYLPRVRQKYAFDEERFPYAPVGRMRSIERVKKADVKDPDAFVYFLEYFFCDAQDRSRYIQGLAIPPAPRVVTLVILNINDEYRQQWFPFEHIEAVLVKQHQSELWGFALQKSKLENDMLAAAQHVKNMDELKNEYKPQEAPE